MNLLYFFLKLLLVFSHSEAIDPEPIYAETETFIPEMIADHFDYPVGPPDGKGYYNAQVFRKNNHLGEDLNGLGGGNSDLGDPVYAIASGRVKFAADNGPGWGIVVRIVHYLPEGDSIESLYAHFDTLIVSENEWVRRGTQIGTIGNADGWYPAHLHFEMRENLNLPIGGGYSVYSEGFIDPSLYIDQHR